MGLTETLSGFFTDEWARFSTGVENLDPESAERVRIRYWQERARREGGAIVSIPGWDDVIHLQPRVQVSREQRDEYWTARRERRAPNLPEPITAELDRRLDMVRRIRAAPDAEVAGSWGRILTALDNVQDFMSMLSLFGRVALWLAPRVLGRLIPGVNIIIAVSDLLNLLSLIGMTATPLYQLLCKGPAAALAAGVPVLIMKQALKGRIWGDALRSPYSRLAKLRAPLPALTARKLIAGTLETLQTTDQLFGRGISFGALVGLINQGAHAAVLAAQGENLRVQDNPLSREVRQLINRPLAEDPRAELRLQHQAALIMAGAPAILARPEQFGDDEVLMTLTALLEAQRVIYHRIAAYAWQPLAARALDQGWTPPIQPTPGTADDVERLGLDPLDGAGWDLPGTPGSARGEQLYTHYQRLIPDRLGAWLQRRRDSPAGAFAGTIINQTTEEAWRAITGSVDGLAWELAPDWRLAAGLAELGYLIPTSPPPETLWRFWEAARRELTTRGATSLPLESWQRLAAAFGIPLMRQLPPGSRWPDAWRDFLLATPASPP